MVALTDEMIQAGVEAAERKWREMVETHYPEVGLAAALPADLEAEFRANQARLIRAAMEVVVPMVVAEEQERCVKAVHEHFMTGSYATVRDAILAAPADPEDSDGTG